MKLLLVSGRADEGGGPRQALEIAKLLVNKCDIWVALPHGLYFERFTEVLGPRRVHPIPSRRWTPAAVRSLARLVTKEGIQLTHSHGLSAGTISRILPLFTDVKAIHTYHGIHSPAYRYAKRSLFKLYERSASRLTSAHIAVSRSEHELVLKGGLISKTARLERIDNGVEPPSRDTISRLDRPAFTTLRVGVVLRDNFQKNPRGLCRILAKLNERSGLKEVKVACPLEDIEAILSILSEYGLQDKVSHLGPVPNCAPLFAESDVLLSASRWEGLPLAPLEAMSVGTPVVLSNVRGHADLAINQTTGAVNLFEPQDDQAATELLLSMADLNRWKLASQAATQLIESHFNKAIMVERTLSLYYSLLPSGTDLAGEATSD